MGLLNIHLDVGGTGERYNGYNIQWLKIGQHSPQSSDMTFILEYWIVELVFLSINVLRPILTMLAAINPTVVILCLNHKDSVYGHNYVVYLRGAVWSRENDIIYDYVFVSWQPIKFIGDLSLANLSFGWSQYSDNNNQNNTNCN